MILLDTTGKRQLASLVVNRPLIAPVDDLITVLKGLESCFISENIKVSAGALRPAPISRVLRELRFASQVLKDADVSNLGIALFVYLPRSIGGSPSCWRTFLTFYGASPLSEVSSFYVNGERMNFSDRTQNQPIYVGKETA